MSQTIQYGSYNGPTWRDLGADYDVMYKTRVIYDGHNTNDDHDALILKMFTAWRALGYGKLYYHDIAATGLFGGPIRKLIAKAYNFFLENTFDFPAHRIFMNPPHGTLPGKKWLGNVQKWQ
jgi:hypothetical protein